jgi:tetratricopeptide (TPR) repeat protein
MPPYGVYAVQVGAEEGLFPNFIARLGWQWELQDNKISGFRGLTMGLGMRFEGWDLDYSFVPDGDLGCSQTLGLTVLFPQKPGPSTPPVVSNTSVSFKPAGNISLSDKVNQVEVQFHLPEVSGNIPHSPPSPSLQEAIRAGGQKVQENPKDLQAWITLGNLYWESGQPDYALQCFEEAYQLQPSNFGLKSWLEQYRLLHPGAATPTE